VVNHGTILADSLHGVWLIAGANNNSIVNTGDIYGLLSGINAEAPSAANVSINNSGEISSDQNGVAVRNAVGAAPVIVNSGTIYGRLNSILAEGGDRLNVTNTGTLIGNVTGGSANQPDSVTNHGTISGDVVLGFGGDSYKGTGRVSGSVFGQDGDDSLAGGGGGDQLSAGAGVDVVTGNGGNDVLIGAAGNDTIAGGLGNDVMQGGADVDRFIFNTGPNTASNRDTLTDFSHADDTLQFENAVFAKLGGAGILNGQFLRLGAAPVDANDYLIYNKATGILTYDVNGNGAGGAQQVAFLQNKPTLALGDFAVI
jgi:Ca2+-binding RTX toxin-like protein